MLGTPAKKWSFLFGKLLTVGTSITKVKFERRVGDDEIKKLLGYVRWRSNRIAALCDVVDRMRKVVQNEV